MVALICISLMEHAGHLTTCWLFAVHYILVGEMFLQLLGLFGIIYSRY